MENLGVEGAPSRDDEPVFGLAVECERLFAEQIARLEEHSKPNEATLLQDLSQRFAAWAAFLGVFAESKLCLDSRLRHHIEIQEQVLHLLVIMEGNLAFLFKEDEPPKPKKKSKDANKSRYLIVESENFDAISEAIERLNAIGIAIRKSSVTSHKTKVREFAETLDFTMFEGFAFLALKTMYFSANDALLERLAQSMTETYASFLHRRSRYEQFQGPRSRIQMAVPLQSVSEEPIDDTRVGASESLNSQSLPQVKDPAAARLRSPPLSRPKPILRSEPTSLDSHEVKARLGNPRNPSLAGATPSILISQADYSRPTEGSKSCEWCFCPLPSIDLSRDAWQKHVHEDHKPYICIAETCPESSPRFPSSHKWLEHMRTIHGKDWHCKAYTTPSWICPLCNDNDVVFRTKADFAYHFKEDHENIFAPAEVQAIVQQSQIFTPRAWNVCPICCLPIEDQGFPRPQESGQSKTDERTVGQSMADSDAEGSHRHLEKVTNDDDFHEDGNESQARTEETMQKSETKVKTLATKTLTAESIARHIAGHLQAILALTLRIISIDDAMGVSADNQSMSGSAENNPSRDVSMQSSLDRRSHNSGSFLPSQDGDVVFDSDRSGAVPDTEELVQWEALPTHDEGQVEDNFLQGLINSGAFQSHLGKDEVPLASSPPPSASLARFSNIPFPRNQHFIGRQTTLQELEEKLMIRKECRKVSLIGSGGMGKTQVALEFAYRIRDRWPEYAIFWVPAISNEGFEQACRTIAVRCNLSHLSRLEPKARVVQRHLSSEKAGKWLLLVDSADKKEVVFGTTENDRGIADYLPESENGLTLFTTRSPQQAAALAGTDVVYMHQMVGEESEQLFEAYLAPEEHGQDKASVDGLLFLLMVLPLAIAQAAAYLKLTQITLSGYMRLLQDYTNTISLTLQDAHKDMQHSDVDPSMSTIIQTWTPLYEHIRQSDTIAADVLAFISCIEYKEIPLRMLRISESELQILRALDTLEAHAFLTRTQENKRWEMHRLVHTATNLWFKHQSSTEELYKKVIEHLLESFPLIEKGIFKDTANRLIWQEYSPHVFCLLRNTKGSDIAARYTLCMRVGRCLQVDGRVEEALHWISECYTWRQSHFEGDHPENLVARYGLAMAYQANGQHEEATETLEQVEAAPKSMPWKSTFTPQQPRYPGKHWIRQIFERELPATPLKVKEPRSTCFATHEAETFERLAGEGYQHLKTIPLEESTLDVSLWQEPVHLRSQVVCKTLFQAEPHKIAPIALSNLEFQRSACFLKLRLRSDGSTWCILRFETMEHLVLWHSIFLVLRSQDPLNPTPELSDYRIKDEAEIFENVICDARYLHSLKLLYDIKSGCVRLQASTLRGPLKNIPVWTSFITHQRHSPDWLYRVASDTIRAAELHRYIFSDMTGYASKIKPASMGEIKFEHGAKVADVFLNAVKHLRNLDFVDPDDSSSEGDTEQMGFAADTEAVAKIESEPEVTTKRTPKQEKE